ncbi:MAG TPA: hypothetical protein VHO48_06930, partial [Anaerolineaceae bacterium]|nr:hypothetical protein [Anaerolineaceae bacterium]
MKLSIGKTVSSLIIISLLISLAVHIIPVSAATPPALYASGASPDFCGDLACPVVIDPEMMVKDGGNTFSVARVVIVGNFTTSDVLSFTNANGISGSYDSASGVLTLTSSTPLGGAAWQAALRTVTFATSSTDKLSRTIQFTLANVMYFYGTGHYYEYIPNAQLNWTEAKAFTENQAYYGTGAGKPTGVYGLQGYLATIASPEENAFIAGKVDGFGWIGSSDAGHDKIWQWETGPEAGTIFT